MRTIFFDMDGTLGNLYAVEGWLAALRAHDPRPYAEAAVMHNMSLLARYLNLAKAKGYRLGIISWLSRESTQEYDLAVTEVKLEWLGDHLHSVSWDEIHIVAYGTPKEDFMAEDDDILFDDEQRNRDNWRGQAYEPQDIIRILKELVAD